MSLEFRVETATVADLGLLEAWTAWLPGRDVPCAVGGDHPAEAFRAGRLRVICAIDGGERVGISLVAAPSAALAVDTWHPPRHRPIPGGECLVWVGIAVCPGRRQSGLADRLVQRTLDMAATTGYPYVAAVFPVQEPRASALLARHGFVRIDQEACCPEAKQYCVYLASTPTLSLDAQPEIAC